MPLDGHPDSDLLWQSDLALRNLLRFGESLNDNVNECHTQSGSITDCHSHSDTVSNAVTCTHARMHTDTYARTHTAWNNSMYVDMLFPQHSSFMIYQIYASTL